METVVSTFPVKIIGRSLLISIISNIRYISTYNIIGRVQDLDGMTGSVTLFGTLSVSVAYNRRIQDEACNCKLMSSISLLESKID